LINIRQNGRRRGRGGGPRSPNNTPNPGNRQDNRSRGNAVQLHEKYKALARDAQLSGDRVQTEYFLQFADHYFRVLSENRPRFEEQRPRRDDFNSFDDEDQDDGVQADGQDDGEDRNDRNDRDGRFDREPQRPQRESRFDREPRAEREQRAERGPRADREDRPSREDRPGREDRSDREDRGEREQQQAEAEAQPEREARTGGLRPRRPRPRRDRADEQPEANGDERISLEVLPPAIAPVGDGGEAPKPRRRTRRPAADGPDEIAPAA
jgi:hypothetical protein